MKLWERMELRILELMREQYEDRGFTFITHPPASMLPAELSNFRPDAIAIRDNEKEVIEVKIGHSNERISSLRHAIKSVPGWSLRVVTAPMSKNQEPSLFEGVDNIKIMMDEFNSVRSGGYLASAFLIGWSVLEQLLFSLLRDYYGYSPEVYRGARDLISSAELYGEITRDEAHYLRSLLKLKNSLSHGSFSALPSEGEVKFLSSIIEKYVFRKNELNDMFKDRVLD